jgi:hypothetical protein
MNQYPDKYDDNFTGCPPEQHQGHFGLQQAVFILPVILSVFALAGTDLNPHDCYGYWLFMVIVFGMLSHLASWLQTKASENDFGDIAKAQSLHWLHSLPVLIAASLLNKSEQLSDSSASLVILSTLALATLDGIWIGWQFSLLCFFLAICALYSRLFRELYVNQYCTGRGGDGLHRPPRLLARQIPYRS